MQLLRVAWALTGAAICCFLILLIHSRLLKEGQLAAGTCEIVTLDRDSSQPRRTIARQTARCACKKGQIAGTTRARPACVDAAIVRKKQWCEMVPCLEDEGCDLLVNKSGWTCTQPGGRVKTTTAACFEDIGAIRLTVAVSRALSPSSASQCLRGTSSSRSPRNPSTAEVLGSMTRQDSPPTPRRYGAHRRPPRQAPGHDPPPPNRRRREPALFPEALHPAPRSSRREKGLLTPRQHQRGSVCGDPPPPPPPPQYLQDIG
ncbi:chemokine-like protein TAFA-5a isoform X2 [Phycodurus eques]|uniref:chemokine-like protein TAFA-5a isoform X2 n=1 Tax=Phycodurus eques TaxID=693459 RepID=UPI002ACD57C4|nr:chemokine-like protein TAFA-5a isoform X2 [Phycodurus eques]